MAAPPGLTNLRFGYVPMHPSCDAPGDRRRFIYYAKKRGLDFEIASPDRSYDIIVATQKADLSVWGNLPPDRGRIIYDCIDSYITLPRTDIKAQLRGIAKFATRQSRYLQFNHWKAIELMCRRSAAVICSTDEQRTVLNKFCGNTHIILDAHPEFIVRKSDYASHRPFRLVWEGLGENLIGFSTVAEALKQLSESVDFELHIYTNPQYNMILGGLVKGDSSELIRRFVSRSIVHTWRAETIAADIADCDLALIPVDRDDPFANGKPINKLLALWRLGMPVLTSATPAYSGAMEEVGLDMACPSTEAWTEKLQHYLSDARLRRDAGERGRKFVESKYGSEVLLARWDDLFASVLAKG